MYNHNIRARPGKTKVKKSGFEKHEEKVLIALSLIQSRKSISDFQIRHVMKLSNNIEYRLMSDLKHNYQKHVSWDKKARTWKYIGKPTQCKTTLEEIPIKPGLSDNELNIMQTMKQEVKQ